MPQFYLDAIYASVPGAELSGDLYIVPCDTNIALSFIFGYVEAFLIDASASSWLGPSSGVAYPVHPIDTVIAVPSRSGGIICASGFSASGGDPDRERHAVNIFWT